MNFSKFFKKPYLGFKTPAIMSILNITPDSFSDGGKYFSKPRIAIQNAIKIGGPGPYKYKELGDLYYLMGRINDAIDAYEKSIQMKDDFPDTYYALGIAYYRAGYTQKATEMLLANTL